MINIKPTISSMRCACAAATGPAGLKNEFITSIISQSYGIVATCTRPRIPANSRVIKTKSRSPNGKPPRGAVFDGRKLHSRFYSRSSSQCHSIYTSRPSRHRMENTTPSLNASPILRQHSMARGGVRIVPIKNQNLATQQNICRTSSARIQTHPKNNHASISA